MTYKRNFLKKVVLGIDFDKVELGKLKAFHTKYEKEFPIIEEVSGAEGLINFNFKTKEVKQVAHAISAWNIYDKSRRTKINFSPVSLTIEYSEYVGFKQVIESIPIVEDFVKKFKINTVTKLRLRFINEIKIEEEDPLNWNKYINEKMLGPISFAIENSKSLARLMGLIVIKDEVGDIRLNYGLWNPKFPSEIVDKFFILDYNVYSKFPLDVEGLYLNDVLENYHSKILSLFELSIKDGLRSLMNK